MILGVVAPKRSIDSGNDISALVCIAFASLLASPISWTHHWVWAVPAALVLIQAGRWVGSAVLGMIFVTGPMWFVPRGQLLEPRHNGWQTAPNAQAGYGTIQGVEIPRAEGYFL
jgi:alpha-1,2-mannosyltransferase